MRYTADDILSVLDQNAADFTFPMLDNGYVYLCGTRMTLFRSELDWAITIEVFGFSPRSGIPDTHIYTFSSVLRNRKQVADFVAEEAHRNYLANNPHNESLFVAPIAEGPWLDYDDPEVVATGATEVVVRGHAVTIPAITSVGEFGVEPEFGARLTIAELCRVLAATNREEVLATDAELRHHVLPELSQIMRLDEWHHPDVIEGERPSTVPAFQELAQVLATGDRSRYTASEAPNTHWLNWPEGGTL